MECCFGMFSHRGLLMGLDQESEVLSQSMTSGDDLPKSFPRKEMCGKEESIDRDISMDRVKL
ncbi:hypothetical protein CRG98_038010, partial [Punica granatum]